MIGERSQRVTLRQRSGFDYRKMKLQLSRNFIKQTSPGKAVQPPITKLHPRDRAKRVSKIRKFTIDDDARDPFDGMPFATLFQYFGQLFDLVLYTWPVDATIQIKRAVPCFASGDKLHDSRIIRRPMYDVYVYIDIQRSSRAKDLLDVSIGIERFFYKN